MRIGLTFDLATELPSEPGLPPDAAAEFDDEEVIGAICAAIASGGHEVVRIGGLRDLAAFLVANNEVDIVFNIAEGHYGRAREAQVPALLEGFGVPYSGADAATLALCLDKALTKRLWLAEGLPTASFAVASCHADLETLPPELTTGDLFVKPLREGSSMGVSAQSRVSGAAALRHIVSHVTSLYRQPALIEPYLPGPEFTIGLLGEGNGARVLGSFEVLPVLSDYGVKKSWDERTFRPVTDPSLDRELRDLALAAYRSVSCRDFGRVDIRLDGRGEPMLLELNPLPGLRPGRSALPLMAAAAGNDYRGLILDMLEEGISRTRMRKIPHGVGEGVA